MEFGPYTLVRHLADGGMATVWLATDAEGAEVVIKRLLPELGRDPDQRAAFLDEGRLASKLDHPAVGRVLACDEVDGTPFIAMEHIDGIALSHLLAEGPFGVDVATLVAMQILDALEYAHNARNDDGSPLGLIHRDVNPANVMIRRTGEAVLLDFGVARALTNTRRTQTGAVKGTYAYMAPEQIEARGVTPATDLFAVGVTLYEMLCGTRPFGEDIRAVSAILSNTRPKFPARIPDAIVDVVLRSLERDPADRFASALQMRNALHAARQATGLVGTVADVADVVALGRDPNVNTAVRPTVEPPEAVAAPKRAMPVPKRVVGALGGSLLLLALVWGLSGVKPSTQTFVPVVTPGTLPDVLRHDDGIPVELDTLPSAKVYVGQDWVGSTPLRTHLRPGTYELRFEGTSTRVATVTIPPDRFFRWQRRLDELDRPKPTKPKSKDARR